MLYRKGVTVLMHSPSETTPDPACSLDFALIHCPMEPASPRSLEYLAYTPISSANPALLCAMKGPTAWRTEQGTSGREDVTLSSVLRKLAFVTESSLASLSDSWLTRANTLSGLSPPDTAATGLPAYTMIIGVIYDANEINLVAHIPFTEHGKRRFLSYLFDTLPFPSTCTGSTRDFVRGRYRVALALLSLQHHVSRLMTLVEPSAGVPVQSGEQQAIVRKRLEQLKLRAETPPPSFCSDESFSIIFDLDIICDRSVGDGEQPIKDQSIRYGYRFHSTTQWLIMMSYAGSSMPIRSGIARYLSDCRSSPPCELGPPNMEQLRNDATGTHLSPQRCSVDIQQDQVEEFWWGLYNAVVH